MNTAAVRVFDGYYEYTWLLTTAEQLSFCINFFSTSCDGRSYINPLKPSAVKWLHFKVFKAILV